MRARSGAGLVLAMAALAACGKARTIGEAAAVARCTPCHGGEDNASGAPPQDLRGRSDTAVPSVGAHSTHIAAGVDCSACHPKPASVSSPGHMDGRVDLAWGPIATANGALSPRFDEATGTCTSVYCHGSFAGGIAGNAPSWIRVGQGGGACGTCHPIPPSSNGHPQSTACGNCHPGYGSTSVNLAAHVNGELDVLPMSCTSCHGDPTRAATALNPLLGAAPPVDTRGDSSPDAHGVGAHLAHLQDGPFRPALPCTECHVVPASLVGHPTGTLVLAWGTLASTGGATPSYSGGSCASTYCHGATLGAGGTNSTPAWTSGSAEAACGTCHAAPPPSPHPPNPGCGHCHDGYSSTAVNLASHVNGALDVLPMTCTSCHGDPDRLATPLNPQLPAAPPTDTHGDTVSSHVGAHQTHLNGSALSSALACTQCHAVPPDLTAHPTGVLDLTWGTLATGAITASISTDPSFAGFSTSAPSYADGACSATYCHGAYSGTFTYTIAGSDPPASTTVSYAGVSATPAWNGSAACGTCHGVPPAESGVWHSGAHGGGNDCSLCHPDASGTSTADAAITDPSTHVDGKVDLAPHFVSSCFHCH